MKKYYIDSLPRFSTPRVATIGMFDGVHRGHQALIAFLRTEARRCGAKPLVITFDTHPRIVLKKNVDALRLLSTDQERFERLSASGIEDLLIIPFNKTYASLAATEFLDLLCARIPIAGVVMGYDNHFGNKNSDDAETLSAYGQKHNIEIKKADLRLQVDGTDISSTEIRSAIAAGNLSLANNMLGYPYSFSGKVVHGFARGRELGFPTANLNIDPHKQLPPMGVYAVKISIADEQASSYQGMLNLGFRPSFDLDSFSAEVHLLDIHKDLYGKNIQVYPVAKLRDEQKFSSMELLKQRLEQDRAEVRKLLS